MCKSMNISLIGVAVVMALAFLLISFGPIGTFSPWWYVKLEVGTAKAETFFSVAGTWNKVQIDGTTTSECAVGYWEKDQSCHKGDNQNGFCKSAELADEKRDGLNDDQKKILDGQLAFCSKVYPGLAFGIISIVLCLAASICSCVQLCCCTPDKKGAAVASAVVSMCAVVFTLICISIIGSTKANLDDSVSKDSTIDIAFGIIMGIVGIIFTLIGAILAVIGWFTLKRSPTKAIEVGGGQVVGTSITMST